jgi:hypothetical protein
MLAAQPVKINFFHFFSASAHQCTQPVRHSARHRPATLSSTSSCRRYRSKRAAPPHLAHPASTSPLLEPMPHRFRSRGPLILGNQCLQRAPLPTTIALPRPDTAIALPQSSASPPSHPTKSAHRHPHSTPLPSPPPTHLLRAPSHLPITDKKSPPIELIASHFRAAPTIVRCHGEDYLAPLSISKPPW